MLKQRVRLVLALAAAVAAGWWIARPGPTIALFTDSAKQSAASGLPVVMPTPGGRLEVSTVTVYERFKREDVKNLLGVELPILGTTETHLQLRTVYRYAIEMQKAWPIERHGDAWVVRAGEVKPSLPVAFARVVLQVARRLGPLQPHGEFGRSAARHLATTGAKGAVAGLSAACGGRRAQDGGGLRAHLAAAGKARDRCVEGARDRAVSGGAGGAAGVGASVIPACAGMSEGPEMRGIGVIP